MEKIKFVLNVDINGFWFNPIRPEGLKLKLPGTEKPVVFLKSKTPDNDSFIGHDPFQAKLSCVENVSLDMFEFMTRLRNKEFYRFGTERIQLPRIVRGETRICENGKIADGYSPRLDICPEEVETLVLCVKERLTAALNRTLGLLSWQQNPKMEWTFEGDGSLYWGSTRAKQFHGTPLEQQGEITLGILGGLVWDEIEETLLFSNWKVANLDEPLGHELLREARSLKNESLRSCIIMIAAALEVGVKTHCSAVAPDTAWLFEKIQTPPVYRIIKDYLPKLDHPTELDPKIWKELKRLARSVQELFDQRNEVAHTGAPVALSDIEHHIPVVSDILYILDVLRGHEWAKRNVSVKIRTIMGWPEPQRKEAFVTVRVLE